MFSLNDKISLRQFQILLMLDIFGTGVIILPRKAAMFAGRDGWIAFALTIAIAMFAVFLITHLVRCFPNKTFYEYAGTLVSRPIAFVLIFGFVIRVIVLMACELRYFVEIAKHVLLYNTPFTVIAASLLFVSAYAAGKGIETRARIGQIIIWIIFIPLLFVFIVIGANVDFSELKPILHYSDNTQIFGGAFHLLFAFSGIEFILLISPYLNRHKQLTQRAMSSILAVGVLMCVIIVMAIARFGSHNLQGEMWPVLEMMDMSPMPGSFIERQEAIMMSFWILSIFAMISAGLFFGAVAAKSAIKVGKHKHYMFAITAVTFVLSFVINDVDMVYRIKELNFIYLGTMYMLILPAILLILAKLRGINHEKSS